MSDTSIVEFIAALFITIVFFVILSEVRTALGLDLPPGMGEIVTIAAALLVTFLVFFGYHRTRDRLL